MFINKPNRNLRLSTDQRLVYLNIGLIIDVMECLELAQYVIHQVSANSKEGS